MDKLETALMSHIWNVVLTRYNETPIRLQCSTGDLKLAIELLESLHSCTDDLRNRFDEFEARTKQTSGTSNTHQLALDLRSARGALTKPLEQSCCCKDRISFELRLSWLLSTSCRLHYVAELTLTPTSGRCFKL